MKVPAEIRAVSRPVNTVVENTGRSGPKQYPVRKRGKIKYIPGKNPQPHNGKVIGHIVDGVFVPISPAARHIGCSMFSFGASYFAWKLGQDLYEDLKSVFDPDEARDIFVLAALRAQKPQISVGRVETEYKRSFLSAVCPEARLTADAVLHLQRDIGANRIKREAFFLKRLSRLSKDEEILIDSARIEAEGHASEPLLPDGERCVTPFPGFSLLFVYALGNDEPVCAQVLEQKEIRAVDVGHFVKARALSRGTVVADRDFTEAELGSFLKGEAGMHCLRPVFRTDLEAQQRDRSHAVAQLAQKTEVNCLKCEVHGGRFWYSFEAAGGAGTCAESRDLVQRVMEPWHARQDILYESDADLDPKVLFAYFQKRERFKALLTQYQRDAGGVTPNGDKDFSLAGCEFINFIAAVLFGRMRAKAKRAGLLEKMSFSELIDELTNVWRKSDATAAATSGDSGWTYVSEIARKAMEALDLVVHGADPAERRRGRPRIRPEFVGPKRPRGRPRKIESEEPSH